MTTVDIGTCPAVECGGAVVRFEPPDEVTVESNGAVARTNIASLRRSRYVAVWCGHGWGVVVGEESNDLWRLSLDEPSITSIARLDRLDLSGGYDPGGLYHVEFVELSGGDVLVAYELGVARVAPDGRVRWQQQHDQLCARVRRVEEDAVWLSASDDEFGFSLAAGRPIVT